jgi:hypothetical protein
VSWEGLVVLAVLAAFLVWDRCCQRMSARRARRSAAGSVLRDRPAPQDWSGEELS